MWLVCRLYTACMYRLWIPLQFTCFKSNSETFHRLTLDVLTFKKVFKNVKTARGRPASVSVITEVQVMQDLQHFARASDYFLGKTTDEIAEVILHVLEAHLRDIYENIALRYIEGGNKLCVPCLWYLVRDYSQCWVSTQFLQIFFYGAK